MVNTKGRYRVKYLKLGTGYQIPGEGISTLVSQERFTKFNAPGGSLYLQRRLINHRNDFAFQSKQTIFQHLLLTKMSTFDEDGFTKYTGPQRKVEVSRKELLGVGGPRVPKAKQRQQQAAQTALEQEETRVPRVTRDAYEYDPSSDNALRRADQKQLEHLAVKKSKEVTSDLRNVLKISEEAKNVGSETLTTLKNQGEQITRVHEKTVQLEQEISQVKTSSLRQFRFFPYNSTSF